MMNPWTVRTMNGPANEAHHRAFPDSPQPTVTIIHPSTATLVLGSRQDSDLIDAQRAAADNVAISPRRSGGGLVYVDPTWTIWIDAEIPTSSPLWNDDVTQAFWWLGDVWKQTVDSLVPADLPVRAHRGRLLPGPQGDRYCFGSLGPGEVTLLGTKVVGVSQRRTRQWSRFQSLLNLRWIPQPLVTYGAPSAQTSDDPPPRPFRSLPLGAPTHDGSPTERIRPDSGNLPAADTPVVDLYHLLKPTYRNQSLRDLRQTIIEKFLHFLPCI